jgi:steroid delta-isomerase-like uncharacterized protein
MKIRAGVSVAILAIGIAVGAQEKGKPKGSFIEQALSAWSTHDPDKVIEFYNDDVVYEDVAFGEVNHGKAELRKFAAEFFQEVPDLKLEVVSSSTYNDRGFVEWVFSGTDKGIYKTGKKFSVRGASVFQMRAGKCSSNKDYYNVATIMQQVGVLPEKAQASQ